jgi:hypothetical protein
MYLDVVADNFLAPIDALTVINYLNATGQAASASAAPAGSSATGGDGGRVQATFLPPGKDQGPSPAGSRPLAAPPLLSQAGPVLRRTAPTPAAPGLANPVSLPLGAPKRALAAPAVDAALAQVESWLAGWTGSGTASGRRWRTFH